MTLTRGQISARVEAALRKALNIDPNEPVLPAHTLKQLGADSVHWYHEVEAMLLKEFAVPIKPGEFFPSNPQISDLHRFLVGNRFVCQQFVAGKINQEGIDWIKRLFPFGDFTLFLQDPTVENFYTIYTVDAVVEFIILRMGLVLPDNRPETQVSRLWF